MPRWEHVTLSWSDLPIGKGPRIAVSPADRVKPDDLELWISEYAGATLERSVAGEVFVYVSEALLESAFDHLAQMLKSLGWQAENSGLSWTRLRRRL